MWTSRRREIESLIESLVVLRKTEALRGTRSQVMAKNRAEMLEVTVADVTRSMAERVDARMALEAEKRAQALKAFTERKFDPRAKILGDAQHAEAEAIAPELFTRLVTEAGRFRIEGNFTNAKLYGFAKFYLADEGRRGPYGYLASLAERVGSGRQYDESGRVVGLSDMKYDQVQRNGGTLAERLWQLADIAKRHNVK
jgi:hypothetical protein